MACCCDLHLHTYYSDGRAAPEEIVRRAVSLGLQTIAITDHDNTRGARDAQDLAAALGLELIAGIEFTCSWELSGVSRKGSVPRQDVDLLGYGMDWDSPVFRDFEAAALADLFARIGECCASLTQAGLPVSLDDVAERNPRYTGAMQLIDTLVHKGYAPAWNEALPVFQSYWQETRLARFDLTEAIAALHAAGGVAVLAHPTLVQTGDGWLSGEQLATLVDAGLDGIEVYHPRLNAEAQQYFLGLARQFDLLVTGGSDEHGWPQGLPRLGGQPMGETPDALVAALRGRIQSRGALVVTA